MSIVVREADLAADGAVLIDTMKRFLTPQSDEKRYDWLYRQNPHGPARAWMAIDQTCDHSVIGVASAFPRQICSNGQDLVGYVLGDFCLDPRYRSLGPAVQLQRVFLTEVKAGRMKLFYDFPSHSMMAVYKRMGLTSCGDMTRMAKPLRVDRFVSSQIPLAGLASALSAIGNLFLQWSDGKPSLSSEVQVVEHHGSFGHEFSQLAQTLGGRYGNHVQRTANYLNWRFLANPLLHHEAMTARRAGVLVGYAVICYEGDNAVIADVFGKADEPAMGELLKMILYRLRLRKIHTVSIAVFGACPWRAELERLGFKMRERSPVILFTDEALSPHDSTDNGQAWWFTGGDRDS